MIERFWKKENLFSGSRTGSRHLFKLKVLMPVMMSALSQSRVSDMMETAFMMFNTKFLKPGTIFNWK